MKTTNAILTFCMVCLILGCMGVESRTSYNVQTDFSALKSYAWMPGLKEQFTNPMYADFYKEAMDTQLAAKGLKSVEDSPDFIIRTYPTKDHKESYKTFSSGTIDFHEGMIHMEFVDAKSGDLIWEGAAQAYLSEESKPDEVKKDVYEIVADLLKDYPPKVKR